VLTDRRSWLALPPLLLLGAVALLPDAFGASAAFPCPLSESLREPSAAHPFGRDLQGCDLWARTVVGTRTSLAVGFGAVGIGAAVASVLGTLSGLSRRADVAVRTLVDVFLGIPVVLLGLTLLTISDTRGPLHVTLVLSFVGWPMLTRVIRTEVLRVRARDYVEAARALGAGPTRVLVRHVAPNAAGAVLVAAVLTVPIMITTEAVVTYVGAGLQLPDTSWGILLYEAARHLTTPHLLLPGIPLALAVGSLVLLAQVVRDARPPS
jgi:oligopeptide transport system permease protein